jgi:hypothetical protein
MAGSGGGAGTSSGAAGNGGAGASSTAGGSAGTGGDAGFGGTVADGGSSGSSGSAGTGGSGGNDGFCPETPEAAMDLECDPQTASPFCNYGNMACVCAPPMWMCFMIGGTGGTGG